MDFKRGMVCSRLVKRFSVLIFSFVLVVSAFFFVLAQSPAITQESSSVVNGTTYDATANATLVVNVSTDIPANVSFSLNGAANVTLFTNSTGPNSSSLNSQEGGNSLVIYAVNATNESEINTTTVTYFVDTINPIGSLVFPVSNTLLGGVTTINGTANDTLAMANFTLQIINESGSTVNVSTGTTPIDNFFQEWNTTEYADGSYNITLVVYDNAGNVNSSAIISNVTVDNTAPDVVLVSPANDSIITTQGTTLQFNVTDVGAGVDDSTIVVNISNVLYSVSEGNISCAGVTSASRVCNGTVVFLSEGVNTFTISANDLVTTPNTITEQFTVNVDTESPYYTDFNKSANTVSVGSTVYVWVNWTDEVSTIGTVLFKVNGATNLTNSSYTESTIWNISYTVPVGSVVGSTINFGFWANDTSGYSNYTENISITVADGTAPSITITAPTAEQKFSNSTVSLITTITDNIAVDLTTLVANVSNTLYYDENMTCNPGTNSTSETCSFSVSGLSDSASHFIVVNVNDTTANAATAVRTNFTVDTTSPYFNPVPSDQEVNYSESFGYQINGADAIGVSAYSVSDTTNFAINNSGYLSNNTLLSVGTYELTVTVNDTANNQNSTTFNVTVKLNATSSVTANTSTDIDLSPADANITLYLAGNVTTTITVTKETPNTTGATASLTALKGINIVVDSATEGNLTWALIKIYYNSTELTAANIQESSLKIYYYNGTAGDWQLEPTQGVDTTNDYVWANITHFSLFGVFGTAPPGGGGEEEEVTTTGRTNYATVTSRTLEGIAKTHVWANVYPGSSLVMSIVSPDIAFTKVIFGATSEASMAKMTVTHLYDKPEEVPIIGKDYAYLSVDTENMPTFDSAKIQFKVAKSWLTDNGLSIDDIVLYRYSDGKWNALETKQTLSDGDYIYEATTPGFSYFAISTKAEVGEAPEVEEGLPFVEEEAPVDGEEGVLPEGVAPAAEEKPLDWRWIVAIIIVFVIAVISLYIGFGDKKKTPHKVAK